MPEPTQAVMLDAYGHSPLEQSLYVFNRQQERIDRLEYDSAELKALLKQALTLHEMLEEAVMGPENWGIYSDWRGFLSGRLEQWGEQVQVLLKKMEGGEVDALGGLDGTR